MVWEEGSFLVSICSSHQYVTHGVLAVLMVEFVTFRDIPTGLNLLATTTYVFLSYSVWMLAGVLL